MIIPAKIAGAYHVGSWLISMQNAAIIRDHAQYLLSSTGGLSMFGEADKKYVSVLREEILEFRKLCVEWVNSFETLEHEEFDDEWGLFKRNSG